MTAKPRKRVRPVDTATGKHVRLYLTPEEFAALAAKAAQLTAERQRSMSLGATARLAVQRLLGIDDAANP